MADTFSSDTPERPAPEREIEIKFDLATVPPLLDVVRAHGAILRTTASNRAEVDRLLALFPADFASEGAVTIAHSKAPSLLRTCALFRLRLRGTDLAAIPDGTFERGLKIADYSGPTKQSVLCYGFMGTLQNLILRHFPAQSFLPPRGAMTLRRWIARLQDLYDTPQPAARDGEFPVIEREPSDPKGHWQVIVRDDPVNLMPYVTATFQLVLGLTAKEAAQRMREVHEQKMSVVWQGAREAAQNRVGALRSWHLRAETRASTV